MDRLYCTLNDVLTDLEKEGIKTWKEAVVLEKIRSASDFIDRKLGMFVPLTETRRFDGSGMPHLFVDYLLAATTVTDDGETIASDQYLLYPRNRHWPNGPYTRISVDPDATALSAWACERDAVSIAGRWGKYEESIATGATVANTTEISASGTSLLVPDGSKVSPGMVLLIGTEQLLVEATGSPTDSTTNTNEEIDASEEQIDLLDGTRVSVGEVIRVNFEQMKVLDVAGNTALVIRGWNGTQKVVHITNQDVFAYRTYTVKRAINGTTGAAHANGVAISRYIPPHDVLQLAIQLAALKLKIAETGYSGRAGSTELGESFYYKEFPDAVKKIEENYRVVSL